MTRYLFFRNVSWVFLSVLWMIPIFAHAATGAYVTSRDAHNVSVIDTSTNQVVTTIRVGTNPQGIAVSGTGVYVVNNGSDTVFLIDTTDNQIVKTISVGDSPNNIVINGARAYISDGGDTNGVDVINTSTNQVVANVTVGTNPNGIAVSGTGVYVTNFGSNTVSLIDTTDDQIVTTITVGTNPWGIAVSGTGVYVSNFNSNTVSLIDTTDNQIVTTISVGTTPSGIAVSGTGVYVTNFGSNTVSLIDTTDNQIVTTISVGTSPVNAAVSGTGVYVTNANSSNVFVIDTTDNQVTATIALHPNLWGIAMVGSLDLSLPTISTLSPADGATDVATTANLTITFDKTIGKAGTGTVSIYKTSDDSLVERIAVTGSLVTGSGTTQITINPSVTLSNNTSYYVRISSNAFPRTNGIYFAGISNKTTWNFTTMAAAASSSSSSSVEQQFGGGSRKVTKEMKISAAMKHFGISSAASSSSMDSSSSQEEQDAFVHVNMADGDITLRDVRIDDWFGTYVQKLVELGIIQGYKDKEGNLLGLFGPGNPVTLAELAKVGSLLAKEPIEQVATGSAWYAPYVDASHHKGLSVFARSFDAGSSATRGEVIQTLLEALGISIEKGGLPYVDVSSYHPYADAIATATRLGIVSGDDGRDTFRPNDPVNRAEAAKMIILMLERSE